MVASDSAHHIFTLLWIEFVTGASPVAYFFFILINSIRFPGQALSIFFQSSFTFNGNVSWSRLLPAGADRYFSLLLKATSCSSTIVKTIKQASWNCIFFEVGSPRDRC